MDIGVRPTSLSGCWSTWSEQDIDVVLRTDMDSGAVHTRRRFTGRSRIAQVSVTLAAEHFQAFNDWFIVNCRQGSIPTYVITPYLSEEVFQFVGPPSYSWANADNKTFTVTARLYQGSWFQPAEFTSEPPIPITFAQRLAASSPEANFDFSDAPYTSVDDLLDISGNGNDLNRIGAVTIPAGSAFRSTTSRSASWDAISSQSERFEDTPNALNIALKTAVSVTFSLKRGDLALVFGKIWGWRDNNNTTMLVCYGQFPSGTSTNIQFVGASTFSSAAEGAVTVGNNDLDVHIYTVVWLDGVMTVYKNGSNVGSRIATDPAFFNHPSVLLQMPGDTTGSTNIRFLMDTWSLHYRALDFATEIQPLHDTYMSELL